MSLSTSPQSAVRLIAATCAIVAGFHSGAASAQSVAYTPDELIEHEMPGGVMAQASATQSFYYDTNALLQTTNVRSLWGSITTPELLIVDKTPTAAIRSDTLFTSNNFNQSGFSSNDVHSKLNFDDQIQRWSVGFVGTVDSDTTRSSELSNYNNVRVTPVQHLGTTLTPNVSYNFLPTDKLGLTGSYTMSQYGNLAFSDYTVTSIAPSYSHDFDAMNTGNISVRVQQYRTTTGSSSKTTSISPSIGWQAIFTPRLSGRAAVGFAENKQKNTAILNPTWKTQYNFSGSLNFKGDQDTTTLRASRDQYPFGNGAEALMTQVSLNNVHAINDLFSIGAHGSYQSATYQADANGNLKSLASGGVDFIYHITDEVNLTASYQYETETLVNVSGTADKNMAVLGLSYRPKAWTL